MGWNNGMGWGGWFGMGILMIVFWGLVIWGIIALVRYVNAPGPKASSQTGIHGATTSSDEILATRFAQGEIDAEPELSPALGTDWDREALKTEAEREGSIGDELEGQRHPWDRNTAPATCRDIPARYAACHSGRAD